MPVDPHPNDTTPNAIEARLRSLFQERVRVSEAPLDIEGTLWFNPADNTLNLRIAGAVYTWIPDSIT